MDIMTIICISVLVVVFIIVPLAVQIGSDKPKNNNTELDDYPTSDEQIDEIMQSSSIPTAEQARNNSNDTIDDYTWCCALNNIRKKFVIKHTQANVLVLIEQKITHWHISWQIIFVK